MRRVLLSAGGVFVALVLGALAFAFVFITYPDTMTMLLDRAGNIRASILARGFSSQHEAWLRVLLDDRQLVFIGFTVVMRVVLSILLYPATLLWERPA